MAHILVYPGWKEVPYNRCLYRNNHEVEFAAYHGAWSPLTQNITSEEIRILHLHWTADLFAVTIKNPILFLTRYLISVIDILWIVYVRKIKVVWTVHNLYAHGCIYKRFDKLARILLGRISSVVVVHSPAAQKSIIKEFGVPESKVKVVSHGNFLSEYPNNITRALARKNLNIDLDKKVYLFFGSVIDYKGVQELLEAFQKFKSPDAVLLIAGKNALSLVSGNEMQSNIQIHDGYIPDDKLQVYMNAADWVVLPYKQILTSASLITAMGFHKAVIIPQIGTLPDYMHPNGGIIYNSKEKDSLLSALQNSGQIDAQEAGEKNFNKILDYNWNNIQNQTKEIYKSLLNE